MYWRKQDSYAILSISLLFCFLWWAYPLPWTNDMLWYAVRATNIANGFGYIGAERVFLPSDWDRPFGFSYFLSLPIFLTGNPQSALSIVWISYILLFPATYLLIRELWYWINKEKCEKAPTPSAWIIALGASICCLPYGVSFWSLRHLDLAWCVSGLFALSFYMMIARILVDKHKINYRTILLSTIISIFLLISYWIKEAGILYFVSIFLSSLAYGIYIFGKNRSKSCFYILNSFTCLGFFVILGIILWSIITIYFLNENRSIGGAQGNKVISFVYSYIFSDFSGIITRTINLFFDFLFHNKNSMISQGNYLVLISIPLSIYYLFKVRNFPSILALSIFVILSCLLSAYIAILDWRSAYYLPLITLLMPMTIASLSQIHNKKYRIAVLMIFLIVALVSPNNRGQSTASLLSKSWAKILTGKSEAAPYRKGMDHEIQTILEFISNQKSSTLAVDKDFIRDAVYLTSFASNYDGKKQPIEVLPIEYCFINSHCHLRRTPLSNEERDGQPIWAHKPHASLTLNIYKQALKKWQQQINPNWLVISHNHLKTFEAQASSVGFLTQAQVLSKRGRRVVTAYKIDWSKLEAL